MTGRASIPAGLLAVVLGGALDATAGAGGSAMQPMTSQRVSIDNAVHGHFSKCWSLPATVGLHSVTVRFELKRDGSLASDPAIVEIKPSGTPDAAIQAAVAAVRNCTPIVLPSEAYDYWRLVTIKFFAGVQGRPFGASTWPQ